MPGGISSLTTGLSAVKTTFELIKSLRGILVKPDVEAKEVQARLLEIEALVLDARSNLFDAEEENRKLQSRIEELERYSDIGKEFKSEHGVYWYQSYPYCPMCWDVERKPSRLGGPMPNLSSYGSIWHCSIHKQNYFLPI